MHDNGRTKGTFYETLVAFGVLTFASVVLRLELAALTVGLGLWALWAKAARLSELVVVGVVAGGASQGESNDSGVTGSEEWELALTWSGLAVQRSLSGLTRSSGGARCGPRARASCSTSCRDRPATGA